jgi:hypothetical protein
MKTAFFQFAAFGELPMRHVFSHAIAFLAFVFLTTAVCAEESIKGVLSKPQLNDTAIDFGKDSLDWVYYGKDVVKKAGGKESFSDPSGGDAVGGDSQMSLSFVGGKPAESASEHREFVYHIGGEVSFTHTLLAEKETVTVYVIGWNAKANVTANVGAAKFSLAGAVLPATDGDGTGQGHSYGILTLTVSGKVGDTLSFNIATNSSGPSTTENGNVGIQAASVAAPAKLDAQKSKDAGK